MSIKTAWYVSKRIYFQIASAVLLNCSFLASWGKGLCVPVLHCYGCPLAPFACPVGTLQYFVMAGAFPFVVLGTIIAVGVIFGKLLCFYVCPFGFLQDLLFRVHAACVRIPLWLDYGKYVALFAFALILTRLFNEPMFCKICPAGILEAGIPIALHARIFEPLITGPLGVFPNPILDMVGFLFWFKVSVLVIVLFGAIFIRRPFCRVMCPLGACFMIVSKLSKLHFKIGHKHCSCEKKA
jgi:polyferredoxin